MGSRTPGLLDSVLRSNRTSDGRKDSCPSSITRPGSRTGSQLFHCAFEVRCITTSGFPPQPQMASGLREPGMPVAWISAWFDSLP